MTDGPQRFRVIENPAKPKRKRRRGEAEFLSCTVCERDIGVSTRTTMEVKQGRMVRDGKPEGGSRMVICVECLSRGKVTKLLG